MEAGVEEAGVEVSSSSPPCTPPGPQRLGTPQEELEVDITVPDSQSQTEVGQIKRPADIGFDEMQGKRIKSDTES